MSLAARYPACLRCVARRAVARPAVLAVSTTTVPVRGKKTGRRDDNGVVVQLLEDVPQYGAKNAVIRIGRGRMRNLWFPKGIADYVTTAGATVQERDPFFTVRSDGTTTTAGAYDDALDATAGLVPTVAASRAAELLAALPPLVFPRRPIAPDGTAIFGSVSVDDIVAAVRAALQAAGGVAAHVRIENRDVRFVEAGEEEAEASEEKAETNDANDANDAIEASEASGPSEPADPAETAVSADRVKALGRWEIEIAVRGTGAAAEAVRTTIEVVAQA